MAISTSQLLLSRMRSEGLSDLIPDGTRLVRVYASRADRSAGAWSWCALTSDGSELFIGSQYAMDELLKANKWDVSTDSYGSISIDPIFGE